MQKEINTTLVNHIHFLLERARKQVVRVVNSTMVQSYFEIVRLNEEERNLYEIEAAANN